MTRIAVLLTGAILGLGALGCGGSDDQSTTGVSLPTVTAPATPQAQAPTTTGAGASTQSKPQQGTAADSGAAQGPCPAALSESDCRALAEAVSKGDGAQSGGLRCTPEMTPEACNRLKELAGSKGSSGSSKPLPGCEGLSRDECLALIDETYGR